MNSTQAVSHRVPKSLLTSDNCMVVPNDWAYSYGTPETTFAAGELLIVDLTACPQPGQVVIMCRAGRKPFGRLCHVGAASALPRGRWTIAVLDADQENLHGFKLCEYEWFGVVTGRVPSSAPETEAHAQVGRVS